MSAKVTWDGLEELRAALRELPTDLTAEADGIVQSAVDRAEQEIRAGYGEKSGNLRDHLVQERRTTGTAFGVWVVLKNTAKHAWLWDNGTEARHYFTDAGVKHETGAMWGRRPPPHTFVRAVSRWRRWMYGELKGLLQRHGLLVSGDA